MSGQDSTGPGRRRALLIGVTNYQREFKTLVTPIKNVEGLERELKTMDFDVRKETDEDSSTPLTQKALVSDITHFSSLLQPGDTVFFYFSGHGVRIGGQQYVLPQDVAVATLEEGGLAVSWIVNTLASSKARAIVVVIESCTTNEDGTGSSRLAKDSAWPPPRTFIVYPVQANQPVTDRAEVRTGRSFFADSLISVLEQTCLDYSEAFDLLRPVLGLRKQVPEFLGKLDERFSFWCPAALRENRADGQLRMNLKDGLTYSFILPGELSLGCRRTDFSCAYGAESAAWPFAFLEETRLTRGCLPDGSHCRSEDALPRTIKVATSFWIGQTEVTVEAYRRIAKSAPALSFPPDAPLHNLGWFLPKLPVSKVTLEEAQAYCAAAGGHLPSELEWEFAARRGFEGQEVIYPWSPEVTNPHDYSNFSADDSTGVTEGRDRWQDGPLPVAWFPPTPGTMLFDMAGNVAEWVAVPYAETEGDSAVVRGGSWRSSKFDVRLSARLPIPSESRDDSIGFRCVIPSDASALTTTW